MCICINGLMFYLWNTYTVCPLHFCHGVWEGVNLSRIPGKSPSPRSPGIPSGVGARRGKYSQNPRGSGWSKSIHVASLQGIHTACTTDNSKTVTCLVCLASVHRVELHTTLVMLFSLCLYSKFSL